MNYQVIPSRGWAFLLVIIIMIIIIFIYCIFTVVCSEQLFKILIAFTTVNTETDTIHIPYLRLQSYMKLRLIAGL